MSRRYDTIRGYRLDSRTGKEKPDKEYDYLKPKKKTQEALDKLQDAVNEDNKKEHTERNCYGKADQYTNYDDPRNIFTVPTDEEAKIMCSGCPLFKLCEEYADTAKPAWGVWAGKVYGRELDND